MSRAGRADTSPAPGRHPAAWTALALCAEVGGDFFYPEKGGSSRDARSICASCPVRGQCLADALTRMGEYGSGKYGVWGGTTFNQREWLLDHFSSVQAAVAYAMEQDCTIDTVDMQPRKAAA